MAATNLEITSKVHELQAKIIPDCLFECIFFIILQFSLHLNNFYAWRHTWRSGVRSAMRAASQLSGRGPTDVDVAPVPTR